MFTSQKAAFLVRSAFDSKQLLAYDDASVQSVIEEINSIIKLSEQGVMEDKAKGRLIEDKVKVKWLTMDGFAKRKKRCLMAYVNDRMNKIERMRWDVGSELPIQLQERMSSGEHTYFDEYCKIVDTYMNAISLKSEGVSLNLFNDVHPPKSTMILVSVVADTDQGILETSDGQLLHLTPGSMHFVGRGDVISLIRTGVLKEMRR